MLNKNFLILITLALLTGCTSYRPVAPDKEVSYKIAGALKGAASGAVKGAQVSSGTGPGALVGAGLGLVAGGIRGAVQDSLENHKHELQKDLHRNFNRLEALEAIAGNYERRLANHPTRDIYPAGLFFVGDSTKLCQSGKAVVKELASLNRTRLPWSRFAIVSYIVSDDKKSPYARHLSEKRGLSLANLFIKEGMEPRRLDVRSVLVKAPVVIDPKDNYDRYAQAIEFVPLDF